jgi:hypothetical protein
LRYKYRLTKYDPKNRNELGHYLVDEWTSVSDVGKSFNGSVLTQHQYEAAENAYLLAIRQFAQESGVSAFRIQKLEMFGDQFDYRLGQELSVDDSIQIARLALREELWCQLHSPRRAYIHFGYDYYVYLAVPKHCPQAITNAHSLGLFVEPFLSPYL